MSQSRGKAERKKHNLDNLEPLLRRKRYYKYIKAKDIKFFFARQPTIRFSQPGALNDPFEEPKYEQLKLHTKSGIVAKLSNRVEAIDKAIDNIYQDPLLTPLANALLALDYWSERERQKRTHIENENQLRRLKDEINKKLGSIDKTFGILSLTTHYDDLLMWAHYADAHTGAVVELDIGRPDFRALPQGRHCLIDHDLNTITRFPYSEKQMLRGHQARRSVIYQEERPLLWAGQEILVKYFFRKSPHWAYEEEYRIVRNLDDALPSPCQKDDKEFDIFVFELPPKCICALLFGARFGEREREQMVADIRKKHEFDHVALYRGKTDDNKFLVRFEKID
jgi:hypothetical protein